MTNIIKKTIFISVVLGLFVPMRAQSLHYAMQRSSANVAAMSDAQNLQVFLSGSQSFAGFEGAPKHILLNVCTPLQSGVFTHRSKIGNVKKSPDMLRNFVGATVSCETYGVHSIVSATVGYNFRLFLSERTNLTFGLGGGTRSVSSTYSNLDSEAGIYDKKETAFLPQYGARLEIEKLCISAFTNNKDYLAEIVWGSMRYDVSHDETSAENFYENLKRNWSGELSILLKYSAEMRTNVARFSANAVFRDKIGVGLSFQTNKDLSANLSVRLGKAIRLGYAYQLANLNPMAKKHEIAIAYQPM